MVAQFDWGDRLPTLTTSRLALRWLEDDDADAVYAVFREPQVMRYWSRPAFTDPAEALALIHQIRELFQARSLFQWGIAEQSSNDVIGTCTLFRLDPDNRRGEIGFALGLDHWGQGFASEAIERLIRFCFDDLDLHRLEADADPRNERSLRLLERQGFQREGLLRERYHVNNEIQDAVFLGLLRNEWKRPAMDSP